MGALATILAHQGGWDEALLVLGPLMLIGLLLYVANRRADAIRQANTEAANTEAASSEMAADREPPEADAPTDR